MAGRYVTPVQANGKLRIQGTKNSTDLKVVATAIGDAINTYLDGTDGTHTRYVVEVKVSKMQV